MDDRERERGDECVNAQRFPQSNNEMIRRYRKTNCCFKGVADIDGIGNL